MEHEPVAFLDGEGLEQMTAARHALAEMLSCDPDDLALVDNATSGVNTVMRSLEFAEGDEILVPDHAYQACRNTIDFVAKRWGAKVVTVTSRVLTSSWKRCGHRPYRARDDRHRHQPHRPSHAL